MKQRKVISLPTNQSKIYRQILAFMNFLLNLTPQERDVLAELIRLDNEYSALPRDKRAKFILSTDVRKEIRDLLSIQEKQFNVIISRLKKKTFFGKSLIDENNYLHSELLFKPDSDGFKFEVNFVMTTVEAKPVEVQEPISEAEIIEEKPKETKKKPQPPKEYKYDASKAPIIEEEEFDISLDLPNE